jgi:hypothetical protein
MKKLQIKTHKMKNTYSGNYFFILFKGLNAGKPLDKSYPNYFMLFSKCEEESKKLFWLCFGLWQRNFFHPFLTGSVIPFIRLDDLRQVIRDANSKLNRCEFEKSLSVMYLKKATTKKKILMVLDNARYHHAKINKEFIEEIKSRITLIYLPPYSPQLNPIEFLWKKK